MSWDTTDEGLKGFFAKAGDVASATIIFDRFSGKSRGFGFVEMASDEAAKEALKLNGQVLDGRTVVVNEARPQAPREDRPGGNFSRGGGDFRRDDRRGGGPRSNSRGRRDY